MVSLHFFNSLIRCAPVQMLLEPGDFPWINVIIIIVANSGFDMKYCECEFGGTPWEFFSLLYSMIIVPTSFLFSLKIFWDFTVSTEYPNWIFLLHMTLLSIHEVYNNYNYCDNFPDSCHICINQFHSIPKFPPGWSIKDWGL